MTKNIDWAYTRYGDDDADTEDVRLMKRLFRRYCELTETTSSTNPPGVVGVGGQSMTGWLHSSFYEERLMDDVRTYIDQRTDPIPTRKA